MNNYIDNLIAELKGKAPKQVTEQDYEYGLNCLPPIMQASAGFVQGEPYVHDNKGKALYYIFKEIKGKFYKKIGYPADFGKESFWNI